NIYYSQWRLAERQLRQLDRLVSSNPAQHARVDELEVLFRQRGEQFALAARATVAKRGGTGYFYGAANSEVGRDLSAKLSEIAASERQSLEQRIAESVFFAARTQRLTDILSVMGVAVGFGAIFLGWI